MRRNRTLLFIWLLTGMMLLAAAPVWANLAANTQIINQAKLSYNDGVAVKSATASVTVTVGLVAAPPNIAVGGPQSTPYSGAGTVLTDSYTVTAAANGPDTYTLSAAVTGSTNTSGATATPTAANVALGASVTAIGSTNTVIVVPADGNLPGEMPGVNGISVNDTVVINGEVRTVAAISDNINGTSTITLNAALSAAPGVGVLVAEQKVVTTTVTSGTITTAGTDITVSGNVTATSVSAAGISSTSGAILNTFTSGLANFFKYVRNESAPAVGTGVPNIYNGNSYYPSGIKATPGQTLEYILVATNSGNGPLSAVVVTDVLPTDYVTLKPNSYGVGKEVTYVSETTPPVVSALSAATDLDAAKYDALTSTLTVNIGTGATNAAGGTIAGTLVLPVGNKTALVLYKVTLNP